MKVACIQLSTGENYNKNCNDIIKYINEAIKNKADLIALNESSFKLSLFFIAFFNSLSKFSNIPII